MWLTEITDVFEDEDDENEQPDADRVLNGQALSVKSEDSLMMAEFVHHKRGYYMEKFGLDVVTL